MNERLDRRSVLCLAAAVAFGSRSARGHSDPTGGEMSKSIDATCAAYLGAWTRKDLDGIAAHIHPAVHFKAPMQELKGRESFLAAAARMFPLLERFDTRGTFVSGDRAMFAYDFVCREPIGVSATAELVRFEEGLIRDVELFFDARPFEAFQRAQAQRKGQG